MCVITMAAAMRGAKLIPLKSTVDAALSLAAAEGVQARRGVSGGDRPAAPRRAPCTANHALLLLTTQYAPPRTNYYAL